jgi:hypothetical protein
MLAKTERPPRDGLLLYSRLLLANGSLQLREYPSNLVRLSCEKCGRAGQYPKQNLIARYGADIRLPDLRWEISQCRTNARRLHGLLRRTDRRKIKGRAPGESAAVT